MIDVSTGPAQRHSGPSTGRAGNSPNGFHAIGPTITARLRTAHAGPACAHADVRIVASYSRAAIVSAHTIDSVWVVSTSTSYTTP
jgi:hypothetical protein